MSRLGEASAAKVKRSASVPCAAMPCRVLLARRLLDRRRELRLHQAAGALGDQRLERDAVDDVERVDDVALGLGHLLAVLVADQAGDVDVAERHVAHELQSHHHHAGDPEEDDVEAGDQHAARDRSAPSSPVRSGQPSVENGHSAEENQVSSTSSSWRSAAARRRLVARRAPPPRCGRRRPCPAGSYQAGMRWPHHSWRLTHQSLMLRIHSK